MNGFKLLQLQAFYWVAELGSFHAAARHLNKTQPGVSIQVQQLERTLGVQLFDRTTRRIRLTNKGRALRLHAESMLAIADEIRRDIGNARSLEGVVSIGAVETVALTWLPELIFRLERAYPDLAVELLVDSSLRLFEHLQDRKVDLAFVVGSMVDARLRFEPLCEVDLAWTASTKLNLPCEPLSPEQLATWPIISHSRATTHYRTSSSGFGQHRPSPSV